MVNLVKLDFPPKVVCFGYLSEEEKECLIVTNSQNGKILLLTEDGYPLKKKTNEVDKDFDNLIEKMGSEAPHKSRKVCLT